MTTQLKKTGQKRAGRRPISHQLARLRAENARLRAEVRALKYAQGNSSKVPVSGPALPTPDADGYYPAEETLDVIVARQIIYRRQAAGWTQVELAERAGVRQETVSRIESGKHVPNVSTVDRIDRALKQAGA
ncbi:MAG TPA: helix-turn-helix domain-containing protein [Gemmataceae bacterium]|jgi:ribosome-binding protein aMBF1 (putative translation factor)|nr:helix-turn-helix domain-containing protein [Gemmataceae bacterium]